jgi:hypothetical protein
MAYHGSSIVDFSTCCTALRSRSYAHRTRVGASSPGYFSVRSELFLRAIAVNIWYAFAIVLSVPCLLCM